MMLTTIAGGLGRMGIETTFDLNPRYTQIVPRAEEACVCIIAWDGSVVEFIPESLTFLPDVSTYHKDDGVYDAPHTEFSGLDPAVDPAKTFDDKASGSEDACTACEGAEAETTAFSGLDPATDPAKEFEDKAQVAATPDGVVERPRTVPSGADPVADPDKVFEPKASVQAPCPDTGAVVPTTTPSGVDPAVDPDKEFRDKASGSESEGEGDDE